MKLFFLAVRQTSKPMANGLKRAAQSSDVFTAVLAATGRTLHRVTLQITRASEGKDQLATVAKLAEKAAIQRGADLLSEAFIYSVAGATVYYEWSMQQSEKVQKAAKDAANEAQRREDMRKNEERQWDEVRRRRSCNAHIIYARARHTHTHTHKRPRCTPHGHTHTQWLPCRARSGAEPLRALRQPTWPPDTLRRPSTTFDDL